MDVSKVTIGLEARNKLNNLAHLSKKQKSELRKEHVFRLIRMNPGKRFTPGDIVFAAGYRYNSIKDRGYKAGIAWVNGLEKKGIIKRLDRDFRLTRWEIVGDKVAKPTVTLNISDSNIQQAKTANVEDKPIVEIKEVEKKKFSFKFYVDSDKAPIGNSSQLVSISLTNADKEHAKSIINQLIDNL